MATIRDVAKLAGVSVSTVSRVLNKNGYVHTETENKVADAIQRLDYEPNAVARGLANQKTMTLALILPDITNPYFPLLSKAVENVARAYGYSVILCNADDHLGEPKSYIELLRQAYIGGIIFATHALEPQDIDYLNKHQIPFVVLDRAPTRQYSVVRSRNYEGAKLAVRHLLDSGCRQIAHIYGPPEIFTASERRQGYMDSVQAYDWYRPELMVPGDFQLEGGMEAAKQLMERHPDIDGIFAGNDLMAVGALKALLRMGIKVPEQVAICGFDGIFLTEVIEPELTTIAQPIYEMGALAVKILLGKIAGSDDLDQVHELEVSLVVRQSTKRGKLE
ncbi:LacI family DNA-binding transcriptional regulator [Paenibacillus agricola]|uniref:LacI family transcriptional regulator n=1 Tax=Paenibacillus agricola TaxID=2716264 RepID=A0ABX0JHA3_9BACL|nr:LacI family DNA-binding transcriptional regulator [Paenibacillus agricola]NHN33075.1 LacI family transcriptional regulator [Paenibacillus agricola]